jgi:periplasmic divalent cation tolerance protein
MAVARRVTSKRSKGSVPRAVLILAAYPTRRGAERAARDLLRARVLACATVLPGARAFYRWKGRERADPSALLLAKTTAARARAAVRAIHAAHPDEIPEILVVPVRGGHEPYLEWLAREVGPGR